MEFATVTDELSNVIEESNDNGDVTKLVSPSKRGIKRKACPEKWRKNVQKHLRIRGKAYEMKSKSQNEREERKMKPPCNKKCRLKCCDKFTEVERNEIFTSYWNLGDITKQREFIRNSITEVKPSYRYIKVGVKRQPRRPNNSFHFMKNCSPVRVCKLVFKNTLDINDRPIRTVLDKMNKVADVVMNADQREKHLLLYC